MVSSPEAPSGDDGEVSSSDSSVCGDLEDGEVEEKPKESIQLVSGSQESEVGRLDHSFEDGEDPDLEDGEVDEEKPIVKTSDVKISSSSSGQRVREEERELEPGEELEEGEVSDDEDRKNKGPIPICRFFGKGQCTWGSNCRFLHPGVIDKGLYTMFDQIRPAPAPLPGFPPVKPGLLGHAPPSFPIPVPIKHDEPIIESAWERAQRHAKEIIKQAEKRKETDIDFEDKKMNLTLTQEEFDKENDYYVKKLTTPERDPPPEDDIPEIDEWDLPSRRPLPLPPPHLHPHSQGLGSKIDVDFVRERVHHLKPNRVRHAPPRDSIREAPPLHEPEVRMVRESSFRKSGVSRFHPAPQGPLSPPAGNRVRRSPFEDRPPYRGGGDRDRERKNMGEGWRDPWDRPQERKSRKNSSLSKRSSYSSGSSRSSSSSRSSKSSKGSRSRSRSRSRSSHSSKGSPRRRKGRDDVRKAPPRRLSPKPMRIAPPLPPQEGFIDNRRGFVPNYNNRPTRYAPPPPRPIPGGIKDRIDKIDPTSSMKDRNPRGVKRQSGWNSGSHSSSRSRSRSRSWSPVKRRVTKRSKFSRERSRSKSRNDSWSRSRSSSSSSRSSQASISKSRVMGDIGRKVKGHGSPSPVRLIPPAKIKVEAEDRKFMKSKQQDTKPKVKMTLRPSSGLKPNKSILDKLADVMGDEDDDDVSNPNSPTTSVKSEDGDDNSSGGKMKPSRREELLKQLQLVEEAIAKKRSKII